MGKMGFDSVWVQRIMKRVSAVFVLYCLMDVPKMFLNLRGLEARESTITKSLRNGC